MEVKKLILKSERKKRRGIINAYLIRSVGNMECGNVLIKEFKDKYEIRTHKRKLINQLDLSNAFYEFLTSKYYNIKKPFILHDTYVISFSENDDYNDFTVVFQKLNPYFQKL